MGVFFLALLSLSTTGQVIALTEGLMLLPYAYVLGLVPALLCAFGDVLLANKATLLKRFGGSACVGFVVTAPFAIVFNDIFEMLVLGLVGAVTSVVCSSIVLAAEPKSKLREG
jgi:hypothetical protein